jgi:hypothetical protein
VEQFKKVIRFCRLQFAAALTPDKQTTRGNWQIELTQIATTLEAHNCQPPVIFLIGTFKGQESYFMHNFFVFLTVSRLKGPLP